MFTTWVIPRRIRPAPIDQEIGNRLPDRQPGALQAWLDAAGIKTGAIFRRIHNATGVGKALSPSAVREIVKKRCALAGLEEEFSAHSLRSGFVTEAGRRSVALADVMALTGHSSVNTVMKYFRPQEKALAVVDKLFDDSSSS